MFILHTHSGKQIQLEWGTYAMHIYCEKQGIDLSGFGEQMSSMQFSIPIMVALIQSAAKAATKEDISFEDVCTIIDDCGGILATSGPLHEFANYMINRTIIKTTDEATEEKKS